MSTSKNTLLLKNSHQKNDLAATKEIGSQFERDRTSKRTEDSSIQNQKSSIWSQNDFSFIDEEIGDNMSSLNPQKKSKHDNKNKTNTYGSSQNNFLTQNEGFIPNLKHSGNYDNNITIASQKKGIKENQVTQVQQCHNGVSQFSKTTLNSSNSGGSESRAKSVDSTDSADSTNNAESPQSGVVRVIITNIKHIADEDRILDDKKDFQSRSSTNKVCRTNKTGESSFDFAVNSVKNDKNISEKCSLESNGKSDSGNSSIGCGNDEFGRTDSMCALLDEKDDDPYNTLEEYLEKIEREINEAFEQHQRSNNNGINSNSTINSNSPTKTINNLSTNRGGKSNVQQSINENICNSNLAATKRQISREDKQKLEKIKLFLQESQPQNEVLHKSDNNDIGDVDVWADSILKELDKLVISDQNECFDNEGASSRKNILKPEKHTTIPLQSFNFNVESRLSLPLQNEQNPASNSSATKSVLHEKSSPKYEVRPGIITSPPGERSDRKVSPSLIWTSEESILKSEGPLDEDKKSTSSSICEETSTAFSSSKSRNSLDSPDFEDTGSNNLNLSHLSSSRNNFVSNLYVKNNLCSNSLAAADDPDILDVLSLCDDDLNKSDCKSSDNDNDEVILRNKSTLEIAELSGSSNRTLLDRTRARRSFSNPDNSFPSPTTEDELYTKKNISPKRPFYLTFTQEPFRNDYSTNIRELPSPSTASLHNGQESVLLQELVRKSSSAPILLKKEKRNAFCAQHNSLRCSRSQSDRYLAEIEAIEACNWLRKAGFPQYAQMYEDRQFPIDLSSVAKDHPLLENDPLQSLYRRLCVLNRCATMRLDSARKQGQQPKDDSDDEGFALSENWMFQPQSRRWSRVGAAGLEIPTKQLQDAAECSSKDSSPERFESDLHTSVDLSFATLPLRSESNQDQVPNRLRRSGSERLKDGAKAFLRRVESIKTRRRKRQNREGLVISGPQVLDLNSLNLRDVKPTVTFSSPPSPATSPVSACNKSPIFDTEYRISESEKYLKPHVYSPRRVIPSARVAQSARTSPQFFPHAMPHLMEGKSDDTSSYYSDSQDSNNEIVSMRRQSSRTKRFFQRTGKVDDIGIHSDSECQQQSDEKTMNADGTSNTDKKVKKLTRGGSLNLKRDSQKVRKAFQTRSFRSRSSVRKNLISSESDKEETKSRKSPIARWHSFREKDNSPQIFKKCILNRRESISEGTPFAAMSSGQLHIVRKLALVTLTGYMERYCPTHRSGWNWELPKFIKKIKSPDYKDKKVFGIPFLLVLQRTGYSLPFPIRAAFRWLRLNAFDQIGLFRKSGVKSRITKLKELIESSDVDCMDIYDTQQAYDVADMLKQYFRDLPDPLLTAKMSETFVAIFLHHPSEVRSEAIQSAVMLLPDENREVLFSLLEFLNEIAANSQQNQMTASNLAVCWAPSLFSTNISAGRSTTVSPRRRKVVGVPDAKELAETRASHECLTFMILYYKYIFTASQEKVKQYNFGYMEESKPVPLDALGEGLPFQNWRGYLYECTSATIKEGREKSRWWISVTSLDPNVEIACKKVGDGHPLRLWRCVTEVEAPPIEVLDYILKERNSWDLNLIKSRIVQKLDDRNEIFQYICDGQTPTDYCVLRSWQSDLPKGACVIVETSVEHCCDPLLSGAIRGVVLASRFLIEPCGSGRSRIMHLARVDMKGRTPEFYNKCYGHICAHYLSNIRTSFRHVTEGPESKV